jgi:hypothetical protein
MVEQTQETPKEDNTLRLMDVQNIGLICTVSPKVKAYLELDLLTKQTFAEKKDVFNHEPSAQWATDKLRYESEHPIKYLYDFISLAKKMKAKYVKINGGTNTPIKLSFSDETGFDTWYYLAPNIRSD